MKKSMLLIGCGMFLCVTCSVDTVPGGMVNKLHKALHYAGKSGEKLKNIDLGRIVLLFSSQEKKVNYTLNRTKEATKTKDVYLFPLASISGAECQSMVKQINNVSLKDYGFNLRCVTGSVPGLELSIAYDQKKVAVELRQFKTINAAKAVEFRFYNQSIINTLAKRFATSMRVSSLKKKRSLLTVDMEEQTLVRPAYWA